MPPEEDDPRRQVKSGQVPLVASHRFTIEDAQRWKRKYEERISMLKIAEEEGVDPGTVSSWLRKVGIVVRAGYHFVSQPPLQIGGDCLALALGGAGMVRAFLESRTWGIRFSGQGLEQLSKYCEFVRLHESKGVTEAARSLGLHRSTVLEWRKGTDLPYLIRAAFDSVGRHPPQGWKSIPLSLGAGGNRQDLWVDIPIGISSHNDFLKVLEQVAPLQDTFARAEHFGISRERFMQLRPELIGYLLGVMLGDAGKLRGSQERFASMNLDLQLTQKEASNQALGEFVCMCANSLGIRMGRIGDKQPSGDTMNAEEPAPAYRWTSSRSILLAWLFKVGLGLGWDELTSTHQVRMSWLESMPFSFRKRFVQGVADSDATVRPYSVESPVCPMRNSLPKCLGTSGFSGCEPCSKMDYR